MAGGWLAGCRNGRPNRFSACRERTVRHQGKPNLTVMSGMIKSFDAGQGYGFISCAEIFAKHGRDVFVHTDQLGGFKVGQQVSFCVRPNAAGHPQACNVAESATLHDLPGVVPDGAADSTLSGKYVGTVKNINELKACGFIQCEELHQQFGRDVFFPLALLPGLRNGGRVEFQAQLRNGQPRAFSISHIETPPPAAQTDHKQPARGSPELDKKFLRACASSQKDSYSRMFELLHHGADPNARDVTGQTALMVCALNVSASERKCRLLVGMGADVHATYTGELTVLQWARERLGSRLADHLAALSRGEQVDCLITLNTMGATEV